VRVELLVCFPGLSLEMSAHWNWHLMGK